MSDPFLAEIKIMSFNFAPKGWAQCNGALMPINQGQALFSLLGTTFGGDGRTTYGLPNLQGAAPMHVGQGHLLGEVGGEELHTLITSEMPTHAHLATVSNANATIGLPTNNFLGAASTLYQPAPATTTLAPSSITSVGNGGAHENRQPYLALLFCIALQGVFPSRN